MTTLDLMLQTMSVYNTQLNVFIQGMDMASEHAERTSASQDTMNNSLTRTGSSLKSMASGMKKLMSLDNLTKAAKKVMGWSDEFTNAATRLSMVNDGLQTQEQLQNKVFAAAGRARGNYSEMAATVSQLSQQAGDSFGSNNQAIRFTELLQKSLKISGAGTGEQQEGLSLITQSMAEGGLKGNEIQSVMDKAPVVAQAIAGYLEVTTDELGNLCSEGVLTADVIKNALFFAADDINDKFADLPMTFADVWNRIKNTELMAFGEVFKKLNDIINSDDFRKAIDSIIKGLIIAGRVTADCLNLMADNWEAISAVVVTAAAAIGVYKTAQWAANLAMYACPVVWIIGLIVLLIAIIYAAVAAINDMAGTTYSATGIIFGAFMVLGAFLGNIATAIWNAFVDVVVLIINIFVSISNFLGNVLRDPLGSIARLFFDLADTVLGILQLLASAIDTIFGSKLADSVQGWRDSLGGWVDKTFGPEIQVMQEVNGDDFKYDRHEYGAFWDEGYHAGEGVDDYWANLLGESKSPKEFDNLATASNPATVKGTGKGGSVEVNMADEDIQYLRDLAQRDYVAKIANNTLAPNVRVEFTGPISKEVDTNILGGLMAGILKNEIAATAEGVY